MGPCAYRHDPRDIIYLVMIESGKTTQSIEGIFVDPLRRVGQILSQRVLFSFACSQAELSAGCAGKSSHLGEAAFTGDLF